MPTTPSTTRRLFSRHKHRTGADTRICGIEQ
jgi:hypothetical protein